MAVREFLQAWIPAIVVLAAAQVLLHVYLPRVAWFATISSLAKLYGFGAIIGSWFVIRRFFWAQVHPGLRTAVETIERNARS